MPVAQTPMIQPLLQSKRSGYLRSPEGAPSPPKRRRPRFPPLPMAIHKGHIASDAHSTTRARNRLVPGNDKVATWASREIADDRGFDVNRLIHIPHTRSRELTTAADKPRNGLVVGWNRLSGDLYVGYQPAIMARTPSKPASGVWYRSQRPRKCSCSGTASGSTFLAGDARAWANSGEVAMYLETPSDGTPVSHAKFLTLLCFFRVLCCVPRGPHRRLRTAL